MGVVALPSRVTGLAAISISAGDHVHARTVGEFELFPVRLGSGSVLALDFYDDGFISHSLLSL